MDISHLSAFGKKGFFLPFIAPSDFSGINYLLTPLMYIMSKPHITTGSKASKERTRSVITKDARRVSFWLLFWKGIFNRKSPIKGAMGKKGYCWTLMWHWLAWLFLFRLALMDVWSLLSSWFAIATPLWISISSSGQQTSKIPRWNVEWH